MSYPSQPGYQTSPYGQPQPPQQQQNNLWMIGGAILVVLVIVMTVILLVVQQTAGDDSADGGEDPTGGTDSSEGTDSGDDGGDDGGDTSGGGSIEINAEACDAFDMTKFEETYGTFIPEDTYVSASNSGGLASLSCGFYGPDVNSVNVYVSDYEDASYVLDSVASDADYYSAEQGYEISEYNEIGDAGSLYTLTDTDLGYKTINIHVALGSLDVKVYTSLWDDGGIDEAAAIETLEDFLRQSETLFADYM
jgi:hypothetical protein